MNLYLTSRLFFLVDFVLQYSTVEHSKASDIDTNNLFYQIIYLAKCLLIFTSMLSEFGPNLLLFQWEAVVSIYWLMGLPYFSKQQDKDISTTEFHETLYGLPV